MQLHDSTLGRSFETHLHVIEKIVRSLARCVLQVKKFDPVAELIQSDLKWMFPKQLCEYRTLCILFKLINTNNVPYFRDYFSRLSCVNYSLRKSACDFKCSERPKTSFGKLSFKCRAPIL